MQLEETIDMVNIEELEAFVKRPLVAAQSRIADLQEEMVVIKKQLASERAR
jgi:hypothetical protein